MRYKELVQYEGERGNTLVPQNYPDNPQLGLWVRTQRKEYKRKQSGQATAMTDDRVNKLNTIGFVWDVNEAAWEEMFQQLKQYKHDHGHTLVPQNYPNNPPLGFWVSRQRHHRKDNKLAPERIDKLNEVDFVWDVEEAAWEEMFQELFQYKHEHGNTLVPRNYSDHPRLGSWVDAQRQNRKKNKLAPERVDKLDSIGFVWDPLEAAWEETFEELKKYKKIHGDTLVPRNYSNNSQLGRWVDTQRSYRKKNKLAPERVAKLDSIGFVRDPLEAAWEEMFEALKKYKKIHGDTLVPRRYSNDPQLGTWVDTQRLNRKKNKLAPDRVKKLNLIGFVWDAREAAWEEKFQELEQFKHDHGHTIVPRNYPDNQQLANWVVDQRQYKRKNTLAPERVDKLNKIGFVWVVNVWDALEAAWEEMFQQLEEYKKIHGDTRVPKNYSDNIQLATWVRTQRKEYKLKESGKKSYMTDKREDKLNEIGFIWDPLEVAWQSKYDDFVSFSEEFGHTKIPVGEEEHKELHGWCMFQRILRAKGSLKEHRYDQLKRIDSDFFRKKALSSQIEPMIIFELKKNSHEFEMLNKAFFGLRLFPDGVIIHNESVIFVEIDEKYHSCPQNYPIEGELGRMVALEKEAAAQGYDQVIFVRIGTGVKRKVDKSQVKFVSNLLHELKRNAQLKPNRRSSSIHYIDYPEDHHHVLASKEKFEVHVLNSQ